MSDSAAIVLVIAALFAIESLVLVPEGATVFVRGFLRRFSVRASGGLLRLARGRLLVLSPLSASSHHFTTGLPALALDADGIADCAPEDADARVRRSFLPWRNLGRVTCDGSLIRAEGFGSLDCGSGHNARLWARVLEEFRRATPARRVVLIGRWTRMRFSTAGVRRRIERVERACQWLEIFTDTMWVFVVLWCAGLLWLGQDRIILGLLIGGEVAGWAGAFLFWRAHRRLRPEALGERISRAMVMALCFPVALRARSVLARDVLAHAHPAAVAAAVLRPEEGTGFLRCLALRWSHPLPVGDKGGPGAGAQRVLDEMKQLAKELEAKWTQLIAPPKPGEAMFKTYCPRCHASYVLATGECADCPGIALVPCEVEPKKR